LFDTFRELDPGPRDRLDGVSYSKANTRATQTGGADQYVGRAHFIPEKERAAGSGQRAGWARFLSAAAARGPL